MEACCKAREPKGTQLLRDAIRAIVGGAATPRGLETGGEGDCAERPRPVLRKPLVMPMPLPSVLR